MKPNEKCNCKINLTAFSRKILDELCVWQSQKLKPSILVVMGGFKPVCVINKLEKRVVICKE